MQRRFRRPASSLGSRPTWLRRSTSRPTHQPPRLDHQARHAQRDDFCPCLTRHRICCSSNSSPSMKTTTIRSICPDRSNRPAMSSSFYLRLGLWRFWIGAGPRVLGGSLPGLASPDRICNISVSTLRSDCCT